MNSFANILNLGINAGWLGSWIHYSAMVTAAIQLFLLWMSGSVMWILEPIPNLSDFFSRAARGKPDSQIAGWY